MKSNRVLGYAIALHQELDPNDKSPEGKVLPGSEPSQIELVLVQQGALWDLSTMHRNAGVLSTLIGGPAHHVLVNGQLADAPKSGMLRRAPW